MKILLTTLNSKFSHASLALRYLRGVLKEYTWHQTKLLEFTINQNEDDILRDIDTGDYDVVCFSTYIWNVDATYRIAANLKKVRPNTVLLFGGPEVSYDMENVLKCHDFMDGILFGEGEETIAEIFKEPIMNDALYTLKGTAWKTPKGVVVNPPRELIRTLDTIPFPYDETDVLDHRLVYYETSRGCPYSCKYCLSSTFEGLRFFSLQRIYSDINWLLKQKIQTVKCVDRTFNANVQHAMPVLQYIKDHDNGTTCFHFEISAGILTDDFIDFCKTLRTGLVQFEIGVQSTCPEALKAVGRPDWTAQIACNVSKLKEKNNIHLHLDLIAGLPYENYHRFLESFNQVYAMKPDMLQLGFLKLIPGTDLRKNSKTYGYMWRQTPPYQVLSTHWITYRELVKLQKIETLLDRYYQNGHFETTLSVFEKHFVSPSNFYTSLMDWWEKRCFFSKSIGNEEGWLQLYQFGCELGMDQDLLRSTLRWDSIHHLRPRAFAGTVLESCELSKGDIHSLLHQDTFYKEGLTPYRARPAKQLIKDLHFEIFKHAHPFHEKGESQVCIFDVSEKKVRLLTTYTLTEINDQLMKENNSLR